MDWIGFDYVQCGGGGGKFRLYIVYVLGVFLLIVKNHVTLRRE